VLLNLVGNPVKFTEHGGVTVSVAPVAQDRQVADAGEDGGFSVCFTVSDTGIGLDEANYGKLFQPFSQVDSSLARKYGGAGLGLAISKRLVELMGGEIGVESEAGKGSDFWFIVPLHPASASGEDGEATIAQQSAPSVEPDWETPTLLPKYLSEVNATPHEDAVGFHATVDQSATADNGIDNDSLAESELPPILLVEDNQVNQKVALAQLKRMGYSVQAVSNGREAVEAVERQLYSVILMDCQMPEMDGFEATRLIRQLEERIGRHVPIIAMTANAMNGDREACLEVGMNDYLAKPIRAEQLYTLLKKWIEVKM
jgi:CheY-like chemotaxis protein